MNLENIKIALDHIRANGYGDDPYAAIVYPFGWECFGDRHVIYGDDIRFTEDAVQQELGIDIYGFYTIKGAVVHSNDLIGVLEHWLLGNE